MTDSSAARVYGWTELPARTLYDDSSRKRAAFRTDGAMVTFNWTAPDMRKLGGDAHPFDQTMLTFRGRQMLEVEDQLMECGPGTIVRIPANARHNAWPIGDEPTVHIDVYAPPRPDYQFLVDHQGDYPPLPPRGEPDYRQTPKDTPAIVRRFTDLPIEDMHGGRFRRAGFRGDNCLITFNWFKPDMHRLEPHRHPFDQMVLVIDGRMMFEIEGKELPMNPFSVARVAGNDHHTTWPLGAEDLLTLDIFAPPRKDYLHLVEYQTEYRGY